MFGKTITLSSMLVMLFCYTSSYAQVTDERSGVVIEFDVDENTFPESWKTKEINVTGVPLDSSEKERSVKIIKSALMKYPVSVLKTNLKKIYVIKSIKCYNLNYGGTNSTEIVYISNSGMENNYTDYYIEKTFHQELSSILFRNYPQYFDEKRWMSYNRIRYRMGGVVAIESSTFGQEFGPEYNRDGFLYQYATSDIENDFNSFAENLFIPVPEFWEAVEIYRGLKGKSEMIIDFYNQIDGVFTKEYFLDFNKN